MDTKKLIGRLLQEEGEVLYPYWDEIGECWTGGVGHNLSAHCSVEELCKILHDKKITKEQSRAWLESDLREALRDCKKIFVAFSTFSEARQEALTDLRFNLGAGGFRNFRRMIQAVIAGNWSKAAYECLDSEAARELPNRYQPLAEMLRCG